ncbi:site-specific integrase [uncultured Methanolobus sp.]|uniref:site-specific integrase n=1 Tax=uncultured Methanolobus sp. TaxID=218300 RepID=UPI0029C7831E|nr:site-specific integrase [uncultured Methanolobus sp.]
MRWRDEPTGEERKKIEKAEIDRLIDKIENPTNRDIVSQYVQYMERRIVKTVGKKTKQGFSYKTVSEKLRVLAKMSNAIDMDFPDMTVEDMETYIFSDTFTKKANGDPLSDGALNTYKTVIQYFYKVYDADYGRDKKKMETGAFPEIVSWFEYAYVDDSIKSDELLEPEDILAMLMAEEKKGNLRNQLLLAMLWDSMGRLNEILSLNEDDVFGDKYGFYIYIRDETSKTFGRRVRMDVSIPFLKQSLSNIEPGKPLFLSNEGARLSRTQTRTILRNAAANAKIGKRVFPHLFRHSKASKEARELPELVVKKIGGWQPDSRAFARYINISDKDSDRKQLERYGKISKDDVIEEDVLVPVICPKCKSENPPGAKGYCALCGWGLGDEVPIDTEVDIMKRDMPALIADIFQKKYTDEMNSKDAEIRRLQQEAEENALAVHYDEIQTENAEIVRKYKLDDVDISLAKQIADTRKTIAIFKLTTEKTPDILDEIEKYEIKLRKLELELDKARTARKTRIVEVESALKALKSTKSSDPVILKMIADNESELSVLLSS